MTRTINISAADYAYWTKTADLIDQFIDIPLNYRQSGHPGGSRSKVHMFVSLLLSGAMRWDIRDPDKPFGDKFVLGAGHTIPLVYATFAIFNEALRVRYETTGDSRYSIAEPASRALYWEDLLGFRRRGGLSGHAEANGKTAFLKANTGPSGHGTPAAAGLAFGLKRAGAGDVQVFIIEGEGGLTPGATHETLNSAYGMALDNLKFLVDWNDFGIDGHPTSAVLHGTPQDWFAPHGWRVVGTDQGSDFQSVVGALAALVGTPDAERRPAMAWFKTRKGRGYLKYDNASHGAPHKANSSEYWTLRKEFAARHGATFVNVDGPLPDDPSAVRAEFAANLRAVIAVLRQDQALCGWLADRLVALGDSVPEQLPSFKLAAKGNPFNDARLWDYTKYPAEMWAKPGTRAANRSALAKWGSWINTWTGAEYGRPVFVAAAADLAASTNLSGFGEGWNGSPGYGWYERVGNQDGVMLPSEITEFSNAGMLAAVASLNLSRQPRQEFDGFYGAVSTYASFSYLKYGPLRLFSQLAQDAEQRIGKFLWVGAHTGPETAEDSRTHFGIFSPGVTQLFPDGQIINLYPWEYNEVPVLLGAAFASDVPIIALHVTRPEITVPDRQALGLPSHFAAARGAYVLRDYQPGKPRGGTIFLHGTSAVAGAVQLLPQLKERGLNVKLVCVTSPELFARQDQGYRDAVVSPADRVDSTFVTTHARRLMVDWAFNGLAMQYALSPDHDNRWRTGGALDEVLDEAHLTPEWILASIKRFVKDRPHRLASLQAGLDMAGQD
jgi:transketolase